MKKIIRVAALGGAVALALAACGSAPEETDETAGGETSAATVDFKACMVSDAGGFDDKSFNQAGFEGLTQAEEELGIEDASVESAADTDYTPNIDSLVAENCNLIIGVGFLLEDPIQTAAEANPDVNFALVDSSFSDADFDARHARQRQADPLRHGAGRLPRGLRRRGARPRPARSRPSVASRSRPSRSSWTASPTASPSTTRTTAASVQAPRLGQGRRRHGVFAGNFDSQDDGKNIGQSFIDQGADIIMPVAGPVGLGTASVAEAAGNVAIIGVDADWFETTGVRPDHPHLGHEGDRPGRLRHDQRGRGRQLQLRRRTSARWRTRASAWRRSTTSSRRSPRTSSAEDRRAQGVDHRR